MTQRKRSGSSARPKAQAARPPREQAPALTILNPNAAGIDVHSDMQMVCVPVPNAGHPRRARPAGRP